MRTAEAPRAALASAFAAYLAFIAYQSLAGAAPGACVVPLVQQGSHLSRGDGRADLVADVPLGRLGTESEVSAAIVFLLSPAAAFVSGSCLRVDGAVPNARRSAPQVGNGPNEPFNAFLLAQKPKVLDEGD